MPQSSGSPNVSGNQPSDYWPGRHFVDWVGVDIFSAFEGAAFPAIASEVWALTAFVVVFATLALFRFRRTLD